MTQNNDIKEQNSDIEKECSQLSEFFIKFEIQ